MNGTRVIKLCSKLCLGLWEKLAALFEGSSSFTSWYQLKAVETIATSTMLSETVQLRPSLKASIIKNITMNM